MTDLVNFLFNHWDEIAQAIAYLIAGASIIVRITPTLKDDNLFLPIIKFLGRYIALNR